MRRGWLGHDITLGLGWFTVESLMTFGLEFLIGLSHNRILEIGRIVVGYKILLIF